MAATAQGAAQLSKVIFKVVLAFKNAPQEMAVIAQELAQFSGSLQTLADVVSRSETLCKPEFFNSTKAIVQGYKQVEVDLKRLIDVGKPSRLLKLRWCMHKSKAKNLLKRIEGIKAGLVLELSILQFAREQNLQTYALKSSSLNLA